MHIRGQKLIIPVICQHTTTEPMKQERGYVLRNGLNPDLNNPGQKNDRNPVNAVRGTRPLETDKNPRERQRETLALLGPNDPARSRLR